MRKVMAAMGLVALALFVGGLVGHATAATPVFSPIYDPMANDVYAVKDTVCSSASWSDTLIPDGIYNYSVTVLTPADANTDGLWINLSPSAGPANTGWMLLRDELGVWTWPTPVDTVFVRGAGAADSTGITRYQVWIVQNKLDN